MTLTAQLDEAKREIEVLKAQRDGMDLDAKEWKQIAERREPTRAKLKADLDAAQLQIKGFVQECDEDDKEIVRLKADLDVARAREAEEERLHGITIDERDLREKQVTEIARILGVESEWSNNHDLGEEAKRAVRDVCAERDAARARNRDIETVLREAMWNMRRASTGTRSWLQAEADKISVLLATVREDA